MDHSHSPPQAQPVDAVGRASRGVPLLALLPFVLITFLISWGVLALYIFLPDRMSGLFGRLTGSHPLFLLAVWAPAIAAVVLTIYHTGLAGLGRFLSRLLLWRCGVGWYVFLIAGVPLVFLAGAALRGTLLSDPFPFATLTATLVGVALAIIKGPVEEFGWRGLALPLLQRVMAPIWAALILGTLWAVWHLPVFLLSGTQQSQWAVLPFMIGCVALSVIVTPLFNASGGSILLAAFFHFMVMNPVLPAAEPYDTYILVPVAAAIVWLNRKSMFSVGTGAATVVVPEKAYRPQGHIARDV